MPKMQFSPVDCPHRRYNPLTGKWILVSPHRAKRPWSGIDEKPLHAALLNYDEHCFDIPSADHPLFKTEPVGGVCRVLCFSPDHSKTLPELPLANIRHVIDTWNAQIEHWQLHALFYPPLLRSATVRKFMVGY
ncbi:hypothetical protein H8A87_12235 [Xenorhabdus sp. VLS]|uniref:Galactose-1-phosphate uridylyltransferase n=1 Tax=Xenorhabdus lircayensis TaxID=2763499 RepID=A0ABS0U6G0_9GAMM|nr:hypothetical protein [Xenorhabdus lircayensis]